MPYKYDLFYLETPDKDSLLHMTFLLLSASYVLSHEAFKTL